MHGRVEQGENLAWQGGMIGRAGLLLYPPNPRPGLPALHGSA